MIRPNKDRLLVKKFKPAEKTATGLYLPTQSQTPDNWAVVVAIGDGDLSDRFSIGLKVLLSKWAGDELEVDGERHLIVKQEEVLAAEVEE